MPTSRGSTKTPTAAFAIAFALAVMMSNSCTVVKAFSPLPTSATVGKASNFGSKAISLQRPQMPTRMAHSTLNLYPLEHSSLLLVSEEASGESWRQYVPLAVSCLVILDILLGSPVANMALAPMKRATEAQDRDAGVEDSTGNVALRSKNPKERVDTEAIASQTLDKARGMLELREYLEDNKTDEKRFEEIRKDLDKQMAEFDSKS